MTIQATPYGTKKEEPFAFTYSGSFVDERDANGIGDVTLNTSGQLTVTGQAVTVRVYILGGGGGGATGYRSAASTFYYKAGGGSGGYQTVEVELTPGTYEIVIGNGGDGLYGETPTSATINTGGKGGDTTAFGYTSTGGSGGTAGTEIQTGGSGGSPNGSNGSAGKGTADYAGGSPNGGMAQTNTAQPGGNGLVRITFS